MSWLDAVVIGLALLASGLLLWSQLLLWRGLWRLIEQRERAAANPPKADQEW